MNRVKDLTLERFSQYVQDQANKLFVTLADETFAKQIKEICTNPDLGEALAQLFKLAYGSNGKVSIQEAAKTLYELVYGSNRIPFVHAWREKLYMEIQSILNCKIKIIQGKYDPLADVIGRAVSKVQQEILAVLENKLGMKFNAKAPSDPSKFHCVIPVQDERGVPFCYMSYSGDNGKVNGEAHRQQRGSQVIKMRVLISQAVQVALMPEIDPHIFDGQPLSPPDARNVLCGMITDSIGFFSDSNGVPPELANLIQSYKTLPASSSSEKARIINRSKNEFDEAAAVAVAVGQQFPPSANPPTQGQQALQQIQNTQYHHLQQPQVQPAQYQFHYQQHADLQQPPPAQKFRPNPQTQGQQVVPHVQPTEYQFQQYKQQHADLEFHPQLTSGDNDFGNQVSRAEMFPLNSTAAMVGEPAEEYADADLQQPPAQKFRPTNPQTQGQQVVPHVQPTEYQFQQYKQQHADLEFHPQLTSGDNDLGETVEESPANSTSPGAAGSLFRFPPPVRNEVMVTENEEDENNKDEKLKKGKGKVANQNSSKKVKTSSRKKKRDETDDAGKVSFLVCVHHYPVFETFIFLIDHHRRRENKQIKMLPRRRRPQ